MGTSKLKKAGAALAVGTAIVAGGYAAPIVVDEVQIAMLPPNEKLVADAGSVTRSRIIDSDNNIVEYTYISSTSSPPLPNEMLERRTSSRVVQYFNDERLYVETFTTPRFAKVGNDWRDIRTATTTRRAFDLQIGRGAKLAEAQTTDIITSSETWERPPGVDHVDVLVVAGGGAGGGGRGGGGGAGGLIFEEAYPVTGNVEVAVGAGGARSAAPGTRGQNGQNSSFGDLVAIGGGAGGTGFSSTRFGAVGGSGGGSGSAGLFNDTSGADGTPGQGHSGGDGNQTNSTSNHAGGGGGGAGGDGNNGSSGSGGNGGPGVTVFGTVYSAGGKGGHNGGSGGSAGAANTGNGGAGGHSGTGETQLGKDGGSGIVVVQYEEPEPEPPSDTCTPTPGEQWNVNLADHCTFTTDIYHDAGMTCAGTGSATITSGTTVRVASSTCPQINVKSGGRFINGI